MTQQKKRGLAALSPERRREIAVMGGKAASKDRKRMRELGRQGGLKVSQDRAFMARIGAMGGKASRTKPTE